MMNKKLATMTLSAAMLLSGTAFGLEFDPKFYVGAEAQYNRLKSADGQEFINKSNGKTLLQKNKLPSVGLLLGSRLNEYFGAELGYTALKQSKNAYQNGNFNVKMHNPYVDALGYIPVSNEVDLIGLVGLGRLSTKVQMKGVNGAAVALTSAQQQAAKTKTGLRLGVGAQYKFDTNVGVRAMVRHQKGNKLIKNVNSVGVGLFYQF